MNDADLKNSCKIVSMEPLLLAWMNFNPVMDK